MKNNNSIVDNVISPIVNKERGQHQYRNQGYATEMEYRLIAWAFQEKGINVVTATCLDGNAGSIKVLEKVGMHRLEPEGNMLKWEIRQEDWG